MDRLLVSLLLFAVFCRPAGAQEPRGSTQLLPRSAAFQNKVEILDGEIPVPEFLRFLSDYTGLPVVVDRSELAADGRTTRSVIRVVASIHDADAEVVKAILEADGWRVRTRTLPNGRQILAVGRTGAAPSLADLSDPALWRVLLTVCVVLAVLATAAILLLRRTRRRPTS
ncbi:MAG: hypothetical protein O7J95_10440 [Planctomycetota bacterium]|nr:hypothetical protein [Planctomycetota bacterium]